MITKYTLSLPINTQTGDEIRRVGRSVEQWRNGQLIATAQLVEAIQVTELMTVGGETIDTLFLETAMPGQNVSMTQVRENQTTGVIIVDFSSGTQLEFATWADVGLVADSLDSTPDLAEKILLGKAFRASPDGTNKTTQVGASVSANLLASTPIVYTEPQ